MWFEEFRYNNKFYRVNFNLSPKAYKLGYEVQNFDHLVLLFDMLGIKKDIYIIINNFIENENAPQVIEKYLSKYKCDFAKSPIYPSSKFCIRFDEIDSNQELLDYINLISAESFYIEATDVLEWNDFVYCYKVMVRQSRLMRRTLAKMDCRISGEGPVTIKFNLNYYSKKEVKKVIKDWKLKVKEIRFAKK